MALKYGSGSHPASTFSPCCCTAADLSRTSRAAAAGRFRGSAARQASASTATSCTTTRAVRNNDVHQLSLGCTMSGMHAGRHVATAVPLDRAHERRARAAHLRATQRRQAPLVALLQHLLRQQRDQDQPKAAGMAGGGGGGGKGECMPNEPPWPARPGVPALNTCDGAGWHACLALSAPQTGIAHPIPSTCRCRQPACSAAALPAAQAQRGRGSF